MSIAERLSALTPEQRALFEVLRQKQRQAAGPRVHQPPPIPKRSSASGAGDWPLSYDQERLWFLYHLDPGSTAYNIDTATRLRGPLDLPVFHAAFNEIVRRHAAWRTSFHAVDGRPVQRVHPRLALTLPVVDLSGLPRERREEAAMGIAWMNARLPFRLEEVPLVRVCLMRLAPEEHLCLVTVHHIATDWVSFQIFWREVSLLYAAGLAGRPSPLPELPAQYSDFALWQRDWLSDRVLQDYVEWWLAALAGFPLALDLPTDRPRPPVQTMHGGRLLVRVGKELTDGLRALARREGSTLFMATLAVCNALLSRLSGQEKILLGSPNANRNRPEIEPLLGYFLTQIVFPADLGGDPTFRAVLRRVRASALGAYEHQELPFGKLVESIQPERDPSRAPLVQAVVLMLDGQASSAHSLPGITAEGIDVDDGNSRYDLMWGLYEYAEHIGGRFEYNGDIFDPTTGQRLLELFEVMIGAVVADPEVRLSELPAMSPAARQQVLAEWNDTAVVEPAPLVVELFERQVRRTPGAVAWYGEGWELTYAELGERAGRLARHLRRLGVGPEALVGVLLERTAELPVALWGVLRAGGAYLPLDLAHPPERRAFMLADAGARLVLTQEHLAGELPAGVRPVLLDRDWPAIAAAGGEPLPAMLPAIVDPEQRAYVIYTSGSTGRPKGVEIPHRALANFVRAMRALYRVDERDVMPALTTIAFDMAVPELYLPVLGGARVPLLSRETASDGVLLARKLAAHGATLLQATPATWRQLLESGWEGSPELLVLGGAEAMSRELAEKLLARGRGLWNFYGPTETTVWSTAVEIREVEPGRPVPIGRPVAETRVHLLDRNLSPLPLGGAGEVCIGGAGVARGYLNRPELTAERFVPDPLSREPGARLYRTGDLAKYRTDGMLEILGRADHQVKLRGFRIELGEIEAALSAHPEVEQAVVLLDREQERLVAYVAGTAPAAPALRAFLKQRLPDYMVPSAFVAVPALPLSPNGKVDRKALARLGAEAAPAAHAYDPPRTPAEELVATLWCEVLGLPRVGREEDFFALGGHSLLATQVVMRLAGAVGVEVPVRAVFQAPTVAGLAREVEARRAAGAPLSAAASLPLAPVPRDRELPLSFAQERLWFIDLLAPGSPAYNMPLALRLAGDLEAGALAAALAGVVRRQESLRTTFAEREGGPVQVVAPATAGRALPVADLSALDAAARAAEVARLALADAVRPFDLARGPLLRTALLRLAPTEHALLVDMHHVISDAWSLGLLIAEVTELYGAAVRRQPARLADLPVQYADYAAWQRRWLTGPELDRQLAYWRDALAGAPATLDLPTDRPRPAVQSFRGASAAVTLTPDLSRALVAASRRRGATPFMTLLAAWAALLGRLSGEDDLVTGTAIANRDRPELERLIGLFVNTLAMRADLGGDPSFAELVARVRRVALDAYAHRDLPFEKLVEEVRPQRDRSRQPLFQVMFVMQNTPLATVELPGLALAPLELGSETAKFDLTLTWMEREDGLVGKLEYAVDLFDHATIDRWTGHLTTLLAGVAADPEQRLSELPLLTPAEREQVAEWSGEAAASPREATLAELFAEQASRRPGAPAVIAAEGSLTYGELDRQAGRLARRLSALGVGPDVPVALFVERSIGMIVGLLAIAKAGGAYVPLDPAHPAARLSFQLADTGAPLLLAEERLLAGLPEEVRAALPPTVLLEHEPPDGGPDPAGPLPESLAYVMYTSGSTGRPKGVAITHHNVVRLVKGASYADLGPEQTFLQLAPPAFDASTLEIWGALANGGRLVLAPPGRVSLADLASLIERYGVTTLWLTAGLFHQMVDEGLAGLRPLRQLLAGGDVLSPPHVRRALAALPGCVLINGYGPTENTTFTCCHVMTTPEEAGDPVPIGRPITGTRTYVLDDHGAPAPVGVWGELSAGGDGVARGYVGRPDLTAERFVPDPFGADPRGARLYRTGDRARWRPDGRLEFGGRRDGQVKVRGFRVELGEVEAALTEHPAVRAAAVVLREDRPGERRLVGYVVPGDGLDGDLRAFLRTRLPEPMVPAAIVRLPRLPLTANGKVDRGALPPPESPERPAERPFSPPSTPLEERLAEASAEVLGRERVSMNDNFFELGGHSLLATQLTARLRAKHGLEVPLELLFDAADFADLADRIVDRELAAVDDAALAELLGEVEPAEGDRG